MMEETPLSKARSLLEGALGQKARTSPPQELERSATSTGSAKLDALIGGPDHVCDGYPQRKITMLYALENEFEDLRSTVIRSCPQNATLFTMREDPLDNLGELSIVRHTEYQKLIADLWVAISQSEGEGKLLIVDDVLLGHTGEDLAKIHSVWDAFLPKIQARLSNRKHTILAFGQMRETPEDPTLLSADGGKAWRYYTAVRIKAARNAEGYEITLDKCKVSSSTGLSTTVPVKDGRFES
jgi:hypothetical protein